MVLCAKTPHSREKGHLTYHSMLERAWNNSNLHGWKRQLLRSYCFSSTMAVVVGDTAEVEELVGEISNPISFSNSLGLKSEVVCNCGRVEGGGSDGGAIVSFFCFLCFFSFFPHFHCFWHCSQVWYLPFFVKSRWVNNLVCKWPC